MGGPAACRVIVLRAVAVDDSAAVGSYIHSPEQVGIAGDQETRVVPLVRAVVDLRPTGSAIRRAVVPTDGTDLAGQINGWVSLASGGHPEADGVSKRHIRQLGETGTPVGRMPDASCGRVGARQPDIVRLVVNSHDFRRRGQA